MERLKLERVADPTLGQISRRKGRKRRRFILNAYRCERRFSFIVRRQEEGAETSRTTAYRIQFYLVRFANADLRRGESYANIWRL